MCSRTSGRLFLILIWSTNGCVVLITKFLKILNSYDISKAKIEFIEREIQMEKGFQIIDNKRVEFKLEMMRKSLKMDEEQFLDKIYDWAEEFNFRIKGDTLIINRETINDFIDALDGHFKMWEKMEKVKIDKLS